MSVQWGLLNGAGQSNIMDLYRAGVADRRLEAQMRQAEAANMQRQQAAALLRAAIGPDGRVDPAKVRQAYAQTGDVDSLMSLDAAEAKARQPDKPYRFQNNMGDLMEIGPDGQPRVVYQDNSPRYISDGPGMGGRFVPRPEAGSQVPAQASAAPPLPPGFEIEEGGPTPPASGNFPR